jgi:SAM-dependent methyltransferase
MWRGGEGFRPPTARRTLNRDRAAAELIRGFRQPRITTRESEDVSEAPNVAHLNAEFPKYPITVEDKSWVYGVWYCGRSFQKTKLYDQFPATFLKRALALFPDAKNILHCPSGTVELVRGVTVDKVRDAVRCPQVVADACALPLIDDSFDLVLSDPPYSDGDAENYGTGHFPLRKAMQEVHRVLRPHGHLGLLHVMAPAFSTKVWKWVGMIGVVTGTNSRMRLFSIFESLKEPTRKL